MNDNMIGKICLVTGGTNGIGRATAHALAQMGATVVIVGRDAQKAAQVSKEIQTASGNQNVDWLLADLSSQQDIRRLAAEFKRKYSQLHVLINNAGGTFMTRQLSVESAASPTCSGRRIMQSQQSENSSRNYRLYEYLQLTKNEIDPETSE